MICLVISLITLSMQGIRKEKKGKLNFTEFGQSDLYSKRQFLQVLLVEQGLTIANFCSLPLLFGQALGKLQGKVVTHSEEVGWWRTLMVECVTLF